MGRNFKSGFWPFKSKIGIQASEQPNRAAQLTIIVVFHNMQREAPRTLFTLSSGYQRGVDAENYKVLAIDNGSSKPIDSEMVSGYGHNFEYIYFETKSMSPAAALNFGIKKATTPYLMFMIDGARLLSPGLIRGTLDAFNAFEDPFIHTLSLHLGHKLQNVSVNEGYNQQAEDLLLDSVDWKTNGYKLFSISNIENFNFSFFGKMPESNCFAVSAKNLNRLGGFDERFQTSGGGLVNLEIFSRYVGDPGIKPVALLGEASFHQFHGGVSTNVKRKEHPLPAFLTEYELLFGKSYQPAEYIPFYWGHFDNQIKDLIPGSTYRQYLKIANKFIEKKKFSEANSLLKDILSQDESDPDVHNGLGNLYLAQGDYKAAEKSYRKSIEYDHFSKGSRYVVLGDALRLQNRLDEAIETYKLATKNRGGGALAFYYLGIIEKQNGNKDQAIAYIERCLEYPGNKVFALVELGSLYSDINNYPKALEVLGKVLEADPKHLWAHLTMGGVHMKLGDEVAGRTHYDQACSLFLSGKVVVSARICSALGDRLINLKEYEKAREISELGLRRCQPLDHPAVLFNLGWSNKQLGRNSEALIALKNAIRRGHNPTFGYQLLAEIYDKLGDRGLAKLALKKLSLQKKIGAEKLRKVQSDLAKIVLSKPDLLDSNYDSFVFTHIEGCADSTIGSTIAESAYRSGFSEEQIYIPGELGQDLSTNFGQLDVAEIEKLRTRDIRIIAEHSPYGVESAYRLDSIKKPFYFTILREPLDRFLSHYYSSYYQTQDGFKGIHIWDLLTDRFEALVANYSNVQIAYISGITGRTKIIDNSDLQKAKTNLEIRFSCFGIYEKLHSSLTAVERLAPSWLKMLREGDNLTPKIDPLDGIKDNEKLKLSHEKIQFFLDCNQLDYKLYHFAEQLFDRKFHSVVEGTSDSKRLE
jgi:tetratricopeptide (TPR) repeat protein